MKAKLEILALVLGFLGMAGAILTTALPMWRVSAYIGANLIVMETLWEGIWMVCVEQIDINMQCEFYESMLSLPEDIQAARGLMCTSTTLATLAALVSLFGVKGPKSCHGDGKSQNIMMVMGGCLFLGASLTTFVPVCWSTHNIIQNFYNPAVPQPLKREIGLCLYLGCATAFILLAAGIILLTRRKNLYDGTFDPVEKEDVAMTDRSSSSDTYKRSQYT